MPGNSIYGSATAVGGSAYGLGPTPNTFANTTARDTQASADGDWLAEYNDNRFFWIRTGTNIQRRNADGDGWENVTAVVQGRQGPPGDDGEDGGPGDKGATGDKGPDGDKGATGDKGPDGDKGATGDKGPDGDKGATGDKGPDGDKGSDSGAVVEGYSFWQKWDANSNPSLGEIATPDYNDSNNTKYDLTSSTEYFSEWLNLPNVLLNPGHPLNIDYEGLLLFRPVQINRIWRIEIGYRLWDGVPEKQATFWRQFWGDVRKGEEATIPLDLFSLKTVFNIGTLLPLDSNPSENFYAVTKQDFDDGFPIKVLTRIRSYTSFTTRSDGHFDVYESSQIGLVVSQLPVKSSMISTDHTRYVGWSSAQQPTLVEFNSGGTFNGDVLTIPQTSEDGYLWFAISEDVANPSAVYFDGNGRSVLSAFDRRSDIETDPDGTANSGDEVNHKVWSTSASQQADILGTGSRTLTLEYN